MASHAAVQVLGQFRQTFSRITHDHFRRLELLARIQRVGKLLLRKSHQEPGLIILVLSRLALEASAVYERHGVTASRILRGLMLRHDHRRVVLVAGRASRASDLLHPVSDGHPLEIPLHGMSAVECKEVILSADHVEAGRRQLLHGNVPVARVDDADAPGNDIILRQDAVEQHGAHAGHPVLKHDFKGLRLIIVRIYRRQPLKGIFPVPDAVALIAEVAAVGAVRIFDNAGRRPVIAGSQRREFLWKGVH